MKKINKKHLIGVLLVIVLTAGISLEIGRVLPTDRRTGYTGERRGFGLLYRTCCS